MSFAETIGSFRADYPLRQMRRPAANDDELRQMTTADGMIDLETTLGVGLDAFAVVPTEPRDDEAALNGRILWVVRPEDLPVALEASAWAAQFENGKIKHSNLTGGGPAHSGGELWVVADQGVLINAASGRYGAENEAELDAFLEVLRSMGLRVASTGFDVDNPVVPNRTPVGPLTWLEPNG